MTELSEKELDEDAFQALMIEEGRLIYEFGVERTYGVPWAPRGVPDASGAANAPTGPGRPV